MLSKFRLAALAVLTSGIGVWASGCGDDEAFGPDPDAGGGGDGASFDGNGGGNGDGGDGSVATGCGDSTGAPKRLLLTMNGKTGQSELVAFDLASKTVAGRYPYASKFSTTYTLGTDPYVLAEEKNFVVRMDPKEPWKPVASFDVQGDDAPDGGGLAEPLSVAVPACKQGYVARFTRNRMAIVDTTAPGDSGVTKYIDLSALKNANDTDGKLEVTGAIWVASHKLVYVLLGGIDITKVATDGFTALCAPTKPLLTAIDPATDSVVSLGGTGPGGSIELAGYSPIVNPNAFVYDPALDRFLVVEAGCNADTGGGVAGPVTRRYIEEVQLATKQVRGLLDLGDRFPNDFAYVDATRAAISVFEPDFSTATYFWNPQSTTLGGKLPVPLASIAHDGAGNLVGMFNPGVDGGPKVTVVRVPFGDGGAPIDGSVETLGNDPFTDNSGFFGGTATWPR